MAVKQQMAFLVDTERCMYCRSCVIACKLENHVRAEYQRNEVVLMGPDQSKDPALFPVYMNCQHCEKPACIAACPVEGKAIEKRESDGRVLIIPDKCDGDRFCEFACPYGAIRLSPQKNKYGYLVVDKCTFCVHKVDRQPGAPGGSKPACMMKCPTQALDFGPREELLKRVEAEGRQMIDMDTHGTGPSNIFLKPRPRRSQWKK
ncbi:MAG: 4Fe-4S dicluster domain-containing protein [Nitrospinae bacterium]|nr:4Fe-4S dicluster domain-containing protein [Nitrospinota bacterium]